MLAAYWLKQCMPSVKTCKRLFLISIPLSYFLLIMYHGLGGWPTASGWKVVWPTIEGGMWALMIAGIVGSQTDKLSWLGKALAWVGIRSFSIYLLHYPIVQVVCSHPSWIPRFTADWRQDALITTTMIVLPIVLLVSTVTWHAIEKPFLSLRKQYLNVSVHT
jgi:peptidoglycan/LPS O-acetylase OafA/YrhL